MRVPARRTRRVLIIVQNLPVPLDRRVWLEATSLVSAGFGVSVICPKGPGDPDHEWIDGVSIHKYDPPLKATGFRSYVQEFLYCWLQSLRLAWRIHRTEGFDVIQACNPPDTYFALAALFRPLGVSFVYDQHDLCPELYSGRFSHPNPAVLLALKLLERLTYRTADHVISTNDSFRRIALGRGRRTPANVTIVRSGPRALAFRAGRADPTLRRGRHKLVAYLGVMGPQDGVDLLVRAVHRIVNVEGRTDTQFALLGFGDCLEELQALASDLGLKDYITLTGRADDTMIRRYLSTADVAVAPDPPNGFNEHCTMNKVLEYMAFGLPIVSFDLPETRVSAGSSARYVRGDAPNDLAECVMELLDDPEARARMGGMGLHRLRSQLAWEHQARSYLNVFEQLLGPAPERDRIMQSEIVHLGDVTSADKDASPMTSVG